MRAKLPVMQRVLLKRGPSLAQTNTYPVPCPDPFLVLTLSLPRIRWTQKAPHRAYHLHPRCLRRRPLVHHSARNAPPGLGPPNGRVSRSCPSRLLPGSNRHHSPPFYSYNSTYYSHAPSKQFPGVYVGLNGDSRQFASSPRPRCRRSVHSDRVCYPLTSNCNIYKTLSTRIKLNNWST
jgi:hypothetical protein